MNPKLVVIGLLIAVGCVYAGMATIRHLANRQVAMRIANTGAPEPAPTVTPAVRVRQPVVAPEPSLPAPRISPAFTPQPAPVVAPRQTPQMRPAPRPAAATARPVSEPEARVALSLVGVDADAEAVWIQAINDPNLSKDARQNLIEDLNEDGFPDPKNITPADLPLIENRLALIEDLAPDAMDDVNTAAFQEAYRDLVNMHIRALGQ